MNNKKIFGSDLMLTTFSLLVQVFIDCIGVVYVQRNGRAREIRIGIVFMYRKMREI